MLKKKILIDLDVLTVAEWEKKDPKRKEAINFLKRVEEKEFYTYFLNEQIDSLTKWKYNELSYKIIEKIRRLQDEISHVADMLAKLKDTVKTDPEEFTKKFIDFTRSKKADLRLILVGSMLKVDYLVTFNRKHLKNKAKKIEKFLNKHNLHIPKIIFPGEVPISRSRINSFSFPKSLYSEFISFFLDKFSKFIRGLKFSHTIKVSSSLFKNFGFNKGISPLITFALVILLAFIAIGIVLLVGLPAIERAKEAAILNEAMINMKAIANAIKEVASEGIGSLRSLQIKVTDGEYKVNEKANSIDFIYSLKSGIIQPGTFIKEDSIILTSGANAKAYEEDCDSDGNFELILENEILKVCILKNGTKDSSTFINTSKIIKIINFKETNANITPSDSSIILDDFIESSYGYGYSELVREDENLAKAEAIVHMNTSFVYYDILFTLQSGADFLILKIQNAYYK